ncbi:MAG: hypothetical protein WC222_04215 [Parachlamydiales bacterium]|jgi:hypothetical protein
MSIDATSLRAQIDTTDLGTLIKDGSFISTPGVYEAAIGAFKDAQGMLNSKSSLARNAGVTLLLKAYTILKNTKDPNSPLQKERSSVREFFSYSLRQHNNRIQQAERVFVQNFSPFLQARQALHLENTSIEHKLNNHSDNIELVLNEFQVGKEEWQELKDAVTHGSDRKAKQLWNSIVSQVRAQAGPQTLPNTRAAENFLLGTLPFEGIIKGDDPFTNRLREHASGLQSFANSDLTKLKAWNKVTAAYVKGDHATFEKELSAFTKTTGIPFVGAYIFKGIPIPQQPPPSQEKLEDSSSSSSFTHPPQEEIAPPPTPPRKRNGSKPALSKKRHSLSSIQLGDDKSTRIHNRRSAHFEPVNIESNPTTFFDPRKFLSSRSSDNEYKTSEDTESPSDVENTLFQSLEYDDDILKRLSDPIPELDERDIYEIPPEELIQKHPNAFKTLSDGAINKLTPNQISYLTPKHLEAIPPRQRLLMMERFRTDTQLIEEFRKQTFTRILTTLPPQELQNISKDQWAFSANYLWQIKFHPPLTFSREQLSALPYDKLPLQALTGLVEQMGKMKPLSIKWFHVLIATNDKLIESLPAQTPQESYQVLLSILNNTTNSFLAGMPHLAGMPQFQKKTNTQLQTALERAKLDKLDPKIFEETKAQFTPLLEQIIKLRKSFKDSPEMTKELYSLGNIVRKTFPLPALAILKKKPFIERRESERLNT